MKFKYLIKISYVNAHILRDIFSQLPQQFRMLVRIKNIDGNMYIFSCTKIPGNGLNRNCQDDT
jgi:hypothetical protein